MFSSEFEKKFKKSLNDCAKLYIDKDQAELQCFGQTRKTMRFLIIMLVLLVASIGVTACGSKNEAKTTDTTSGNLEKTSNIIIDEISDGQSGTFFIEMENADVVKKLDMMKTEWHTIEITNSADSWDWGNLVVQTDSLWFAFDKNHRLYDIEVKEIPTIKGLKIGDTINEMEKLYGKDYAIYKNDKDISVYEYKIYNHYFRVNLSGADNKINSWSVSKYKYDKWYNFSIVVEMRTVKKSVLNDYQSTIDYDLNFVQLTGTYKGIDAINNYYANKEKTDFFGKEYNDYFNIPNENKGYNYYLKANYRVEVQIGNILSISGDGNSWAGGVSNPILYSDVFDLTTGEKLTLGDVFQVETDEYLNLIYAEVAKNINIEIAKGNNRYNFDDAFNKDGQALIKKEFKPENFYLTEKSLVVFYPKYSLGPGAAGTFKFEIPLDSLKDKLRIDTSKIRLF